MTKPHYFAYKKGNLASGDWHWAVGFDYIGRRLKVLSINHGINPFDHPDLTEVRTSGMSFSEEMALRCAEALNRPAKPDDLWKEDPEHPRGDWVYEVFNGDTLLGYWDWVNSRKEQASR